MKVLDLKAAVVLVTLWTNRITMSARTISSLSSTRLESVVERLISLRELGLIRPVGILKKGVDHPDQRWCVTANGKRVMAVLSCSDGYY